MRRSIVRTLACLTASLLVLHAALVVAAKQQQRDVAVTPKVAPGSVPIVGDYWALIIGIDKYTHAPPLETAAKDATGVRDVLLTRYGFKRERVIELLDEQATRTRIEDALFKLGQQAGPQDSVFIYYAGHGQYEQDGRLGWWVPIEGKPQSPGTFITNASIRDYIGGMKAKHVYLIADSCFSGTLFGRARAMPPLNDQFFAKLYANKSRWGLTSGGTEPVADRGKEGHSIFAYHFIKLLKENSDPYLVPSHIFDQIAPIIANNSDQTPRSEPLKGAGDEGGQFVFRLATSEVGKPKVSVLSAHVSEAPPPSAALTQAEQELKALEAEEQKIEEEKRLAAIQQQIEEKKKRIENEKKKQVEVAEVKTYEAPREPGREITGQDGAPMLLVPAGEFLMGSTEGDSDEKPVHKVSLNAFYLDKYEVTNVLYGRFMRETGRSAPTYWNVSNLNASNQPVVGATWHDALAYCRWAGKRLPTEAEWEYAARGSDGRKYPWGNSWEDSRARFDRKRGIDTTAPVGSYPSGASPFGVLDMAGNVWEWTSSLYKPYPYVATDGREDLAISGWRVLRGGSFLSDPSELRSELRIRGVTPNLVVTLGVRCAQDVR